MRTDEGEKTFLGSMDIANVEGHRASIVTCTKLQLYRRGITGVLATFSITECPFGPAPAEPYPLSLILPPSNTSFMLICPLPRGNGSGCPSPAFQPIM